MSMQEFPADQMRVATYSAVTTDLWQQLCAMPTSLACLEFCGAHWFSGALSNSASEAMLGESQLSAKELDRLMSATREYSEMRVKKKFGKGAGVCGRVLCFVFVCATASSKITCALARWDAAWCS